MARKYTVNNPDKTFDISLPDFGEYFSDTGGINASGGLDVYQMTQQGAKSLTLTPQQAEQAGVKEISRSGSLAPYQEQKLFFDPQAKNYFTIGRYGGRYVVDPSKFGINAPSSFNSYNTADVAQFGLRPEAQSTFNLGYGEGVLPQGGFKPGQQPVAGELPATTALKVAGMKETPSPLASLTGGTQSQTYEVKSGDTLSAIAKKYGVSISDITGYRSGNANLIYPGEQLTIKGKTAIGTSEQPRGAEAQQNVAEQERLKKEIQNTTNEIQKLTLQKQLQDLKEQMGAGTTQPTTTPLADQFDTLMKSGDITELQKGINDYKAQVRNLDASYLAGKNRQEDRLAPMELIGSRQQKLYDAYTEQRTRLINQLQTAQDEYNTKVGIIEKIMDLKQTDYTNATNSYNTAFSQALQLQQLLNQQTNTQTDNARANFTTLMNLGKETSFTPDLLQSLKIEAMKAGINTTNLEALANSPELDFQWENTQFKDGVFYILGKDKDGNPVYKSVNTGMGEGNVNNSVAEYYADKIANKEITLENVPADTRDKVVKVLADREKSTNWTDEDLRTTISSAKINKNTYEQILNEINTDNTILNKDRAKLIASEIYGKQSPSVSQTKPSLETNKQPQLKINPQTGKVETIDVNDLYFGLFGK